MRLSTNQIYNSSIRGILDAQEKMIKFEEQLVTGKRVLTASDDPSATQQALLLTERIEKNEQFIGNTVALDNSLKNEEVVLNNIWNSVERAYVLALTTGNTTNTDLERSALSSDLISIREEIYDSMNAKGSGGEYMFSGFQGNAQAYSYDSTTQRFEYQGDEGQRLVKVSETVSLPANDPGKFIFDNAELRHSLKVTDLTTATKVEVETRFQDQFDTFYDNNYPADDVVLLDLSNPGIYEITDSAGTVYQTGAYVDGQEIEFNGLAIKAQGGVGSAVVELQMSRPKDNILNSMNDLINSMLNPNVTGAEYREAIDDAIVGFQNAQYALDAVRGEIGGRLNVSDSIHSSKVDTGIVDVSTRSTLIDADVAQTISDLEKEEFALQAAQQGYVKVTSLSLFDYIR